jgi:cytochrome c biogenesis protein CcdA
MKNKKKFNSILLLTFLLLLIIFPIKVSAQNESEKICAIYLTGIGCPNCGITDPTLLSDYTSQYPNLVIIEYELYTLREYNQIVADEYFESYIPGQSKGIPLIIFDKENSAMGRFDVLNSNEIINNLEKNDCPLPDGLSISFEKLNLSKLEGKIKIWTKDRILIGSGGTDAELLKELLFTEDIPSFLEGKDYEKIEAEPVLISQGEINFGNAIKIGGWIFEWNGNSNEKKGELNLLIKLIYLIPLTLFLIIFLFYKKKKYGKVYLKQGEKNLLLLGIALTLIITFFVVAKSVSPAALENLGYKLPLPLFTFFIALVDGFNPCNLFVLTFLLGLLISASNSRKKIYAIGFTFIAVVFIIYFLFMATWLNIFKYIGFITPLRIAIASIALIAGIINVKEMFAFRKGITLMIQEKHKKPLSEKIEKMKDKIKNGSIPSLILASIGLAAFSSLVELPCTAGFPIIYTGILTGKVLASSFSYYLYLLLYNFIYVIPLIVIITIFGLTFKGKQISKKQMQIIKFIGGLIMIILGLILLINPSLIGIGLA